jgi:hypothetical protein
MELQIDEFVDELRKKASGCVDNAIVWIKATPSTDLTIEQYYINYVCGTLLSVEKSIFFELAYHLNRFRRPNVNPVLLPIMKNIRRPKKFAKKEIEMLNWMILNIGYNLPEGELYILYNNAKHVEKSDGSDFHRMYTSLDPLLKSDDVQFAAMWIVLNPPYDDEVDYFERYAASNYYCNPIINTRQFALILINLGYVWV